MEIEWAFPIEGATATSGPTLEQLLRAMEGMISADVDVSSSVVKLTFDAGRVCGGEILAILRDGGCVPTHRRDESQDAAGRQPDDVLNHAP